VAKRLLELMYHNVAVVFFIASIICATVLILAYHIGVVEAFLGSFLNISVGCWGIGAFVFHWFRPLAHKLAVGIGFPPDTPWQREVAGASLAFGVLGLLCNWTGNSFWTPTAIGFSIFLVCAGIGHIIEIRRSENRSVFNAGSILYWDLGFPVVLIVLLVLWKSGF